MMNKKEILIVEDEVIIAEYLLQLLESVGFSHIKMVHNAKDAEEFITQNDTDLILLDINMTQELSGINLASNFLATKQIPFIYITGSSNAGTIDSALETKPAALITKPFKSADVIAAVKIAFFSAERQNLSRQELSQKENKLPLEEHSSKLSQFEIDRIQEIVQFCTNNCQDPKFNPDDLASGVRMSRRHLYRFLNQHFDNTPANLIKEHRLKLAKVFIDSGKYKRVKDLSFECGFLNAAHFSKEFEKHFGEKPSELIRGSMDS